MSYFVYIASMYTIYNIVNRLNGKFYIGSTENLRRRISRHLLLLRKGTHHSRYLQNAWNKYGEDNFEFIPVLIVSSSQVYHIENQLIKSMRPDYNVMVDVFSHIGIKRSLETCQRISKSLTGKSLSEEHKNNVRKANLGKKQSTVTIAKRMIGKYKKVAAYDKRTGLLFKIFDSATHAAAEINGSRMCIYDVMNNRKNKKSYKGYIWKIYTEPQS
jgi:group I intron endonuclease